jgi:KUP system potassium uptake protein
VHPRQHVANSRTALTLAALGIVYGDIGTSPLYAAKQTFHPDHGIELTPHNVLGGVSVLSAVEGLEVGTATFKPYVLPIAVGVVIGLFSLQRQGTSVVGALFGPVAALWFVAIAVLGLHGIAMHPQILRALDPLYALDFLTQHGVASFVVLGAVLLAFTGAEALYADMGHFGKAPIRIAWFGLVFPALTLNYFGQGALLIAQPAALDNPFYLLAPEWALYPLVALATAATVIASQATISGTYSLTKQAIQLDYLPRMNVRQTSAHERGQIYMPGANWVLLIVIIAAILGFGSSSRLASAYGVAVSGTMLVTTILTFFVIRFAWGYNLALCIAVTGFFIFIDAAFFASSLVKVLEGGWFPLALAAIVFTVMTTWHRGREIALATQKQSGVPVAAFLESLAKDPPHRVPGTAIFMVESADSVSRALLQNFACNKVLHERVIFLTILIRSVPWVPVSERIAIEPLGGGFYRMLIHFGFMDRPDVTAALELCAQRGFALDPASTWFLLSRSTVIPSPKVGMALWRERLFGAMTRNARTAGDYFNIPSDQVIELGTKIEI